MEKKLKLVGVPNLQHCEGALRTTQHLVSIPDGDRRDIRIIVVRGLVNTRSHEVSLQEMSRSFSEAFGDRVEFVMLALPASVNVEVYSVADEEEKKDGE